MNFKYYRNYEDWKSLSGKELTTKEDLEFGKRGSVRFMRIYNVKRKI